MSSTTAPTTTTTQAPASSYHNVPVQELAYQKEYDTGATSTGAFNTGASSYPSAAAGTYPNYQALQQAVPNVSIFLRPIAPPSALGWMSFFAGSFMVFTWLADWYGGDSTYIDVAPFVFFFAGLCQLVAGFYGYTARDTFATVWFPLWGAFFLAWGYYYVYLIPLEFGADSAPAVAPIGRHLENQGLGMWFVILTAVSWACALPALARDITTGVVVILAAVGVTLEMAYFSSTDGMRNTIKAGAYFLLLSALVALFRGWLYLMEEAFYESPLATRFLPKYRAFSIEKSPVTVGVNEPGVKKGQ